MIIGITGKSGSGKSTLSKKYIDKGFTHIEIDEIGHQVLSENKYIIEAWFGTTNRKELGNILFKNKKLYEEFSCVVWKAMEKKIDRIIQTNQNVVLDYILLPQTKYWKQCYRILCKCPDEIRKERVLKRDGITEEYFDLRERKSIEYNEKDMDEIIYSKTNL